MMVTTLTAIPDTEWVVAVDPVDAEAAGSTVRTMAEAAGVGDRLTVQQVDDGHQLAALLRSADAYGCPVTADPTGFATLRAMSCGIPVVGTAVGALVDIVVDDVTGWLVPAGETLKFADAMRRLLHEPLPAAGWAVPDRTGPAPLLVGTGGHRRPACLHRGAGPGACGDRLSAQAVGTSFSEIELMQ